MKHNVKRHDVVQPLDTSYRYIPLTRNLNAIVDADAYEFLSQWNWCAFKSVRSKTFYAVRKGGIFMHKLLLECPDGMECDHKDNNGLNNRKENLRISTPAQNRQNRGLQTSNKTGFIGIHAIKYKHKLGEKTLYMVQAAVNGKQKYLGCRATPEEAAKLYDSEAVKRGEFARLNFH